MLSPEERNEIRQEVYRDMADLHDEVCRRAGSYVTCVWLTVTCCSPTSRAAG